MKNNILIEMHDLIEYAELGGMLYPTKNFIKDAKKLKLDHNAGAGLPLYLIKKDPTIGDNCVVWIDDESNAKLSIKSLYDGEIVTFDLKDYQKQNNNIILGILWIERIFDIE